MRINTDRLFFDPYPLALTKGLVYGIAYGTAIFFTNSQGRQSYYNLIIFLLGFVCEFFELGFFKEEKSHFVKVVSRSVFVGILVVVAFFFCVAYSYADTASNRVIIFWDHYFWQIKILLGILIVWPLATGIYLMLVSTPPDNKMIQKVTSPKTVKHGLGYRAMCNEKSRRGK